MQWFCKQVLIKQTTGMLQLEIMLFQSIISRLTAILIGTTVHTWSCIKSCWSGGQVHDLLIFTSNIRKGTKCDLSDFNRGVRVQGKIYAMKSFSVYNLAVFWLPGYLIMSLDFQRKEMKWLHYNSISKICQYFGFLYKMISDHICRFSERMPLVRLQHQ